LKMIKVLGSYQQVPETSKWSRSWVYIPVLLSVGYILLNTLVPISLLIPAALTGVILRVMNNTFLNALKAMMIASVTSVVVTLAVVPAAMANVSIIFSLFLVFYLVFGLFGWFVTNALIRMLGRSGVVGNGSI
jgi:hypothetical protein